MLDSVSIVATCTELFVHIHIILFFVLPLSPLSLFSICFSSTSLRYLLVVVVVVIILVSVDFSTCSFVSLVDGVYFLPFRCCWSSSFIQRVEILYQRTRIIESIGLALFVMSMLHKCLFYSSIILDFRSFFLFHSPSSL